MRGGIYTEEHCHCGLRLIDNKLDAVCCPDHRDVRATRMFVRFGRRVKKHFTPNTHPGADTYAVAHQFLHGLRSEVTRGKYDEREYIPHSPLAFKVIAERYLEDRGIDLVNGSIKEKTYSDLSRNVRRASDYFGKESIKNIKSTHLKRFLASPKLAFLSAKMRWNIATDIKAFLAWLVQNEEIERAPIMPEVPYVSPLRKTIPRETQIEILEEIERIHVRNPRIPMAVKWLITYVHLRPGDIRAITEADVDRHTGMVLVYDHKTIKRTRDPKPIILTDALFEEVKALPQGLPHLPFFRYDSSLMGSVRAGQGFGPLTLYYAWRKACSNLGIEGVDLYGGTRHSTMQHQRKMGASPEQVKRFSGHKSNKFDRYLFIGQSEMLEGAELAWSGTKKETNNTWRGS